MRRWACRAGPTWGRRPRPAARRAPGPARRLRWRTRSAHVCGRCPWPPSPFRFCSGFPIPRSAPDGEGAVLVWRRPRWPPPPLRVAARFAAACPPGPSLVSAHCARSIGYCSPERKVGPRVAEMRLKMGQHGASETPGFGKLLPEVFSTYAFGKGKKPWPKNR